MWTLRRSLLELALLAQLAVAASCIQPALADPITDPEPQMRVCDARGALEAIARRVCWRMCMDGKVDAALIRTLLPGRLGLRGMREVQLIWCADLNPEQEA